LDLPEGIELPEYDLAGNLRIYGDTIDMGAYEWQPPDAINNEEIIIKNYELKNYPNPFNPDTMVECNIEKASKVKVTVYNLKGQKVKILMDSFVEQGQYNLSWNGTDDEMQKVASGNYLIELNVNGKVQTVQKCTLVK
jgi:flagellar hook assembly protein FlgD